MAQSFSSLVVSIKERVASCGSSGIGYLDVVEQFAVAPKAAFVIAQRFVDGEGFLFKIGEQPVHLASLTFEQFTAELERLRCHASTVTVDRACGVVDPGVILEEEGHLRNILEKVAASGPAGCLISEVARSDTGTQTHSSVDKLVGLGYLVKQSINPMAKGKQCRCDSKAVILHNKVNAPYYDEEADGVKLIVSNSYLERIHSLIVDILDRRNVHSLPARDLARCLGMSRWDMQALRNATIALDKKEGAKVKFFQMMCSFQLENGTLGTERLMWCAARAVDQVFLDAAAGTLSFVSPRNFPVHETIAAALNDGERGRAGVTAADIRAITGASYKRAAKVFTEFHKVLGYPLEKVQDGKQLRHKILPKQRPQQPAEPDLVPPAPATTVSAQTPATLLSDQQLLNCEVIVEFLQNNDGIASVMDIVNEVRSQSRKRQQQLLLSHPAGIVLPPSSNAMDRRTIDRTLHLLEHTMGRVTTRVLEVPLPALGSPSAQDANSAVVLLRETGQTDEHMIATYVARQLVLESDSKAATESGAVGSARKSAPASAKKRKRQVVDSSSSEEEAGNYSSVAAQDAVPKSAAGGKRAGKRPVDDGSGESDYSSDEESPVKSGARASLTETLGGDARLRRTLRNRALKQKKRNDDPALFDRPEALGDALPELPPAQLAGELVAAMCLHAHLLRATPATVEDVQGEEPRQSNATSLAAAIDSLPFEFFHATSVVLCDAFGALQEQTPDTVPALQAEVSNLFSSRATLGQVASAGSETLAALVAECRGGLEQEAAALVSLLAAVGVVRIGDVETRAALAALLRSRAADSLEGSRPLVEQVAARFDESAGMLRAAARPDQVEVLAALSAFADLYHLLACSDGQHTGPVVRLLCGQAVSLEVMPVGAWQQLRSDLDVYHHWRTVVLPSLPVDWQALALDSSLSSLGLHLLRYWECERGGALPGGIPPSSAFKRDIFTALLKMDQWGTALVRQVWEAQEPFSWKALLLPLNTPPPVADMGDAAGCPDSSAFSLDMPRRTNAKQRKPKRPLDAPAKSAANAAPTPRKRKSKVPVQSESDASGGEGDGSQQDPSDGWIGAAVESGARQAWSAHDPQLQEELLGLQAAGSSAEWTAAQVALVLEVVLINFFVRAKKEDTMPGMLRTGCQSGGSVGTSPDAFCSVGLPTSFLDVRWDETDFALVAESLIGAAIAASHIPDQKVARNRILQCIKYRPALRSVVAWILCNKGSRVSPTFARIISQLGRTSGGEDLDEEGDESQAHAVFALLSQSYSDGGEQLPPRKAELEALRRFPFSLVARVTRELFVLGFLRQANNCGSTKCKEAKSACKHTKRAFELTELYDDAQSGIAGALFFKKWLECGGGAAQGGAAGASASERVSWDALLTTAQKEWDTPSMRVLCLSHALSLSADAIDTALDVEVLEGECALAERALLLPGAVTFVDPNVCEEHSGFCEKSLNGISAHLATAAANTAAPAREGVLGDGPRRGAGEVAVPWEVWEVAGDGRQLRVNHALLRLLSAKVMAVLADRPGASAAAIHTAVLVLSAAQLEALLDALQRDGQVEKKVPAVQTRRRGLFASATGKAGTGERTEPAYFVNIRK